MRKRGLVCALFCLLSIFGACAKPSAAANTGAASAGAASGGPSPEAVVPSSRLSTALRAAGIPAPLAEAIRSDEAAFLADLSAVLAGDPALYALVDKAHSLPEGYAPEDLVTLTTEGSAYQVSRAGLKLRREAADALECMARAARADGVTLVASSTYRSYEYQVEVYNRTVAEMGQEAADRVSARPGQSQHQTGLVVDFGSISDEFAETKAGRWMAANAPRFGWSLSFPGGYEALTGYKWESWHYRYVGLPLAVFIDRWFDGIQQYALQFIHAWTDGPDAPKNTTF